MAQKSEITHISKTAVSAELRDAQYPYPLFRLTSEVVDALQQIGLPEEFITTLALKNAPQGAPGDFGFHCGTLAKIQRKNPVLIAEELAQQLIVNLNGLILEYIPVGPYVNIVIDYAKFAPEVLRLVFSMNTQYGSEHIGVGHRTVIDMSSPNIAKRMSIGHLRSTIIGDSLASIFRHQGFEVIRDNHLGDWGTQFGHLLHAIELWGNYDIIGANPIEELQKLYVQVSAAGNPKDEQYASISPEEAMILADKIKDAGRVWFRRLEKGDKEARTKWQQIVQWSLQDFQKMYDILGINFEWVRGESFYEELLSGVIDRLKESKILVESKGAFVVDMEDVGLEKTIVLKSDGATLYLTREIATAIQRADVEKANSMIYVVGEDQKLYFEQFFEILKRMGYIIGEQSKHVYFGMIRLAEGKMSTRQGRVILLEDVVNEAFERTRSLVTQKTRVSGTLERENLVRQVAVGALKWNDLKADPRRSIVFDWDEILSMDGNSGPYVQYAHARAMSLIEGTNISEFDLHDLIPTHELEKNLIKAVASFPVAVSAAREDYNPSKVATYLFELAKAFHLFYHQLSVHNAGSASERDTRLAICASVAKTLKVGLGLLGIEAPNKI